MAKTAGILTKSGWAAIGLLAVAASAAWVFRADIAEYAAMRWLASRGISDAALKVEHLGLHGLDAAGLSLGANGEIAAERLSVRYHPWALIEGRVESVVVEGLSLRLDLRPGKRPLGDLQGLLAGEKQDAQAKPAIVLPAVTIDQARISALTPLGDVSGTFSLRFHAAENGFLVGQGELTLDGPAETASGTLDLAPDGRLALKLDMELTAASGLWAMLPKDMPMRGDIRLTAQGEGRTVPLALKEAGQFDAASLFANMVMKGGARLSVAQMEVPGRAQGVEAQAGFRFSLKDGGLDMGLSDDASATMTALAPEIEAGLPEAVRGLLKGPIKIGAKANGEAPFLLSVSRSGVLRLGGFLEARSASGTVLRLRFGMSELSPVLSGSSVVAITVPKFSAGDAVAGDLAVSLPLHFRGEKGGVVVNLERPGEIRIGRYGVGENLQSTSPLVMVIEREQAKLSASGDIRLVGRLLGRAAGLEVGGTGLALEATPGQWDVTVDRAEGKTNIAVSVSGGGARLPAKNVVVKNLLADVTLDGQGRLEGRIANAEIRHLGKPAFVVPLILSGKIRGEMGSYSFDGGIADKTDALDVTIKAHHGAEGNGSADLRLRPIEFSAGGVQPGQVSPLFEQITRASGSLSARGSLVWGEGKLKSGGRLTLERLSFVGDQTKVRGLDGSIAFDSLLPPSTPAGQRLTVKSINPAVPLQDATLLFSIEPDQPSRLHVAEGSFLLAGGRVAINDVVLVPGATRQDVSLSVSRLDLERLLDLVKVEGLKGTGLLNGRIPLSIAGGTVAISKGLLEAQGGGVIEFRSEAAAKALSGGGEAVTLMLKALRNFHYDQLKVNIRKNERGDAQIGLHLLGRNPDVLEGHPFRFNINLEGNLDRIIAALRRGNRISGDLIRRSTAP